MNDAVGLDPPAATIPALVRWSTHRFATLDAVSDGDVTLTYAELGEQVDRVARALVASGHQPGAAIAIWAPNGWQWLIAALGASRAGCRLVPINTRFKGAEAAYVLNTAQVRTLFVADGFLDTNYTESLSNQDLPALEQIIDMHGGKSFDEFLTSGETSLQAEVERRTEAVTPDDIGLIMFTSGTTGHPKGVMVRGGAIVRAFYDYGIALDVRETDPYLLVNPYFHAFGYNSGIIVCLLFGAKNLPVAVYDPDEVLARIEADRVAVFPGPPALFQRLLNHPRLDDYDISSLRSCVTGAATIPVDMIVALGARLGFERIMTAYGMTETSGIAAYTRPGDPPELIASTSGCAPAGVELRVVDDHGADVAVQPWVTECVDLFEDLDQALSAQLAGSTTGRHERRQSDLAHHTSYPSIHLAIDLRIRPPRAVRVHRNAVSGW
jgi:acyl-CoA synthetase (AMP-forming)/AMP-acid ligase II